MTDQEKIIALSEALREILGDIEFNGGDVSLSAIDKAERLLKQIETGK